MPRSKKRKKSAAAADRALPFGGNGKDAGTQRINMGLAAAGVVAFLAIGYWWWQSEQSESRFIALAAAGQDLLQNIETMPDLGRTHLAIGQTRNYGTPFPTTGPHEPVWTPTGFYARSQRPTQVVHALEHGNIVIYYDDPGAEELATLKEWAGLFGGQWDGLVVTPSPGLSKAIVMTAWRKILRLDTFDPAAAAAFIDAFRGRGPENPVR